jgi:hypothetical protein
VRKILKIDKLFLMVPNPNRLHTDGNGRGNVCETDFDGMVFQTVDNCPNNGKITSTDLRGIQAITVLCLFQILL